MDQFFGRTKGCLQFIIVVWQKTMLMVFFGKNNANGFGSKLLHKLPNLADACHASLPVTTASVSCAFRTSTSIAQLAGLLKRRGTVGYRFPTGVVIGLGVSFWSQLMSMAGNRGGKTFLASARQKGVIEEVPIEVLKEMSWILKPGGLCYNELFQLVFLGKSDLNMDIKWRC